MRRVFMSCFLVLTFGGIVGAAFTLGIYAYYQAYPSMHGWLFATLGVLLLGILLSLPRMMRPRTSERDDVPRCRECGQHSPYLDLPRLPEPLSRNRQPLKKRLRGYGYTVYRLKP